MRPIAAAAPSRPLAALLATLIAVAAVPAFAGPADDAPSSPILKRLKAGTLPEDRQGAAIDRVLKGGEPADLGYLFAQAVGPDGFPAPLRVKVLTALADAAATNPARPEGDLSRLGTLIRAGDAEAPVPLRLAAIQLAGRWKVGPVGETLRPLAEAPGTAAQVRDAAFEALADIGGADNAAYLGKLARSDAPAAARASAVAALARIDVDAAAGLVAGVLKAADAGQDVAPMIAPFLNRRGGPEKLAAAITAGNVPADPAKLALRAVYALGRADEPVVAALSRAAGLGADIKPPDRAEVDRLLAEVAARGDAARGERVFRRPELNCMRCHAVAGAAGGVGPELSSVGASSPVDYLVNSIMAPDQAIKEEFVTKVVQTTDGRVYHGIVVDKDDRRLILREATGEPRVIPADDIEETRDGGSLMPKGLVNFMTRAEFVDLLRFLSELGKPGPYALHAIPTVQRWRVLKPVPGPLAATVPGVDAFRSEVLGAAADRWVPAYATVPGTLDPSELAAAAGVPALYLQGEVNVTAPGPVAFGIGTAEGVSAWVDDRPVEAATSFTAPLATGIHKLTLRVDPAARKGPLKVEVTKPAGSTAEFTVVGGR